MSKRCSACLTQKALAEFSKRAASKDGLNYVCRACMAARSRAWRDANPGAFKSWYAENREQRSDYWKDWYEKNKAARSVTYAQWAKENKHRVNALLAKRNAAKLNATPAWANHDAIRQFYERAALLTVLTGIRHEVDHVFPLQGRLVCGLHCEANLQILTKTENLKKGNRMPEEFA